MACLICPPPRCLELRLVTPEDENVADLVLNDTSELGPRQLPVEKVEVEILDHMNKPIPAASGATTHTFEKGQHSLIIHDVKGLPTYIRIRYSPEDELAKDAAKWGPIKKAAVEIGNQYLQRKAQNKAGQGKKSKAQQNAEANNWGYLATTYRQWIPRASLNLGKILALREGKKKQYSKTVNDFWPLYTHNRGVTSISLNRSKVCQCKECTKSNLYRLVIELRGLISVKPRLHQVRDWEPQLLVTGNVVSPPDHLFYYQEHCDNAINLASLSYLAYACFDTNSAKAERGSIYDLFYSLAHQSIPTSRNDAQPNQDFSVDTEKGAFFLEEKPYTEAYPLEDLEFFYNIELDAEGFAASDKEKIIVSFRGTTSIQDWLTDARIEPFTYLEVIPDSKAEVHDGFKQAVEVLRTDILKYCDKHGARGKEIYVCGHSLGGAMATLMAMALYKEYAKPIMLYTYGSPRVGNRHCVLHMLNKNVVHYRFVNQNDLVPRVPENSLTREILEMFTGNLASFNPLLKYTVKGLWRLAPNVYLHHGNFTHIEPYLSHIDPSPGYTWASVLLSKENSTDLHGKLSKRKDTAMNSGWRKYNLVTHGTDHFITKYIDQLLQAYGNINSVMSFDREKSYRDTAKSLSTHSNKLFSNMPRF